MATIRRAKTDQEGAGRAVGIPYGGRPQSCPVRALQDWLGAAGIAEGPLFRGLSDPGGRLPGRLSDRGVARVVQRRAAGKSERAIMAQTGHKSLAMVPRYIREGDLFRENAAAGLGL